MKTYRVWAKCIDYVYLDVQAENVEEAWEIANNADGGDYTSSYDGELEMLDETYVEEV